ncbi:MAG TPA: OmpH family outer membrane protein [Spirochaetia bacterium]|nr:OmpH family outer membrane protein [Spirochaetales bacterium]HRS66437.1 OmpH family outer membrane protein [Spirochaetia bacterium]HOT58627.1 OmpH family outer membrane protein [Spirochaetales bacterium]HPD80129.1 OmpH family outer membrane protein [Spirochaetales bacterium]HQG40508.1 OmpH family outer membrane protein [Spirochaetales bacterium]
MKANRLVLLLALVVSFSSLAFTQTQQITRIAVVDMQKIYLTYYSDSSAVRNFEAEKQKIQEQIKKLSDEIMDLQKKKLQLQTDGKLSEAAALDVEIAKKAQYLSDFIRIKKAELDEKAQKLMNTDDFMNRLYKTVQQVAESEGYSIVLDIRGINQVTSNIIWFTPLIDITDKVLQVMLKN